MHVHLVAVSGTGMGTLAGLLKKMGHRVTGSDTAFYPPMGEALQRWGIETITGFSPSNVETKPDWVVIGNAVRKTNPEAEAVLAQGLPYVSMAGALNKLVLQQRPVYVVAGTHGKTTTTTLLSYLLERIGMEPGYFVGGIPLDLPESFAQGREGSPFVIEGDEYDSSFFEKTPKFWQYNASSALLTSIEYDHVDIYPNEEAYLDAFVKFVQALPEDGSLVAYAGDPNVRAIAKHARCEVVYYALSSDDCGDVIPTWTAAPLAPQGGVLPFQLFVGGTQAGPYFSPLSGDHNLRNVLGAFALLCTRASESKDGFTEEMQLSVGSLAAPLRAFRAAKRRQELIAEADGVFVYDDFAHHPTAVRETLNGLRARHPEGKLFALFEPRSATACRKLHQQEYPPSFVAADVVRIAPLGKTNIPEDEKLDLQALISDLQERNIDAASGDNDAFLETVMDKAKPGDVLVAMSNGDFGGLKERIVAALAARGAQRRRASEQNTRLEGASK